MKSYKELEVYKSSKTLAIAIHQITLALPKFELYEEGSQIRRSSKAVTAAIVEGYGRRNYKADFIRYLTFALSECDETLLHLEFLFETKSLKDEQVFQKLSEDYQQLSKQLNAFMQWVDKNWLVKPK
jgi:four helix bundle protein